MNYVLAQAFHWSLVIGWHSIEVAMVERTHKYIFPVEQADGVVKYEVNARGPKDKKPQHVGTFASLSAAVRGVKDFFPKAGYTSANLRLDPPVSSNWGRRQYKHITYHKKSNLWMVQSGAVRTMMKNKKKNKNSKDKKQADRYFKTQKEAATQAAKNLKCDVSSLELGRALPTASSRSAVRERSQALKRLYEGDDVFDCLPGDVSDIVMRAAGKRRCVIQELPGVAPVFAIAKQTEDRDALQSSWDALKTRKGNDDIEKVVYDVLVLAARKRSGKSWPAAWSTNVGRGNQFYQTMVQQLRKLGVLTTRVGPAKSALTFGSGDEKRKYS